MKVSVIIPTHNPHPDRLRRALVGLTGQTLPQAEWELVLVDNASTNPICPEAFLDVGLGNVRALAEPTLGLSFARRCGFCNTRGELIILVDDDNVLAPDYLECVLRVFERHPRLGAAGGRIVPEFEVAPPPWITQFLDMLACRDLGVEPKLVSGFQNNSRSEYPIYAPVGAGMAIRATALLRWIQDDTAGTTTDRRGRELTSGGDNDIVLSVLESDWDVGYFPELELTHLIPASRLQTDYLARLSRGIAKSWMQVLSTHRCNPWPPIPSWSVPLRKMKAWFAYRAWAGPAEKIRWAGACGHFEGRAASGVPWEP
jgi:glycosyltransferase involved in cell wall biosynthesis